MKKNLLFIFALIAALFIGVVYGIGFYRYQLFPYSQLQAAYHSYQERTGAADGPWSIGVYEGETPFELTDPQTIVNPVLTADDVTDIDAKFVADPFLMIEDNHYTMFFEVLDRSSDKGVIAYAESQDGLTWEYKNVILDEPFHLSYPYVFKWEDEYYLVPESYEDLSVKLYRAVSYPDKWEAADTLLTGYRFIDPSIFRHDEKWWLFVTTLEGDTLNLYYAEDLFGTWTAHPQNPLIKLDKNISRPAGRVLEFDNKLFRLTQDGDPSYGLQVFAFEITELSKDVYTEELVSEEPLVAMSGEGWNAAGMHHVDAHQLNDKWIAAVDGRSR